MASDAGRTFFNKPWLEFTGRPLEQEHGDGLADDVRPPDDDRARPRLAVISCGAGNPFGHPSRGAQVSRLSRPFVSFVFQMPSVFQTRGNVAIDTDAPLG